MPKDYKALSTWAQINLPDAHLWESLYSTHLHQLDTRIAGFKAKRVFLLSHTGREWHCHCTIEFIIDMPTFSIAGFIAYMYGVVHDHIKMPALLSLCIQLVASSQKFVEPGAQKPFSISNTVSLVPLNMLHYRNANFSQILPLQPKLCRQDRCLLRAETPLLVPQSWTRKSPGLGSHYCSKVMMQMSKL